MVYTDFGHLGDGIFRCDPVRWQDRGTGDSGADFAVARYKSDGSSDTSFSDDGKVTTDCGGGSAAYSVAIQSNGKIVVEQEQTAGTYRGATTHRRLEIPLLTGPRWLTAISR